MKPLIGMTCAILSPRDGPQRLEITATYGNAVTAAGGLPVIIAGEPSDAAEWACRLDGLLLTGGGDVAPARYGADSAGSRDICPARDEMEILLVRKFRAARIPILGICRGVQVMNVALGGTLYQDLPGELSLEHHLSMSPCHGITVRPGSFLSSMPIVSRWVNSTHHQAVRDIAPGLEACAWSEDGRIVEALEAGDGHPALGVQWHPERMGSDPGSKALFAWLVDACGKRRRDPHEYFAV